jgi:D-alanyl-D-alanine carboxypeptidase
MLNNIFFILLFGFSQFLGLDKVDLNDNIYHTPEGVKDVTFEIEEGIKPPQNITGSLGVEVRAKSAIVIDRKSKEILFEKSGLERRAMASLTKIMTALVFLESKQNLDDNVIIENTYIALEGADIDLGVGEELTLNDLLHGTLVASGNDAASALAEFTSGNLDDFVLQMNKRAVEVGMMNTHFENVSGLDAQGHYSTARDMAKLADIAFENPKFSEVTATKEYGIMEGEEARKTFRNTNQLLHADYPNIKGGKTGYTDNAGFCLITMSENDIGNQIITVILGEEENGQQFQDTKALVDWTFKTYKWPKEEIDSNVGEERGASDNGTEINIEQ